jgi:hypothetical protein
VTVGARGLLKKEGKEGWDGRFGKRRTMFKILVYSSVVSGAGEGLRIAVRAVRFGAVLLRG